MKRALFMLLAGLACAGCSTIHLCDTGDLHTTDIENSGWYLFTCLPIASGDADAPNEPGCRLFSDTVTLENNMKLLDEAMRRAHAKTVRNVTSYITDEKILFVLMSHKVYHTSAELVVPSKRK